MKILADENIDAPIVELLRQSQFDWLACLPSKKR